MPKKVTDPDMLAATTLLHEEAGLDLAEMRENTGVSQEAVAKQLSRSKYWLSRMELGKNRIFLADYLLVAARLRVENPKHPAVALYDYLWQQAERRSRIKKQIDAERTKPLLVARRRKRA